MRHLSDTIRATTTFVDTSDDLIAVEGFDQAEDPIAALADQIADRLAIRLGPQLTGLVASTDPAPARELWSARRVAAHYGVGVSFVYQHADELGCVRLGGGRCPRLRFVTVQARWAQVGGALPAEGRQRRRSKSRRRPAAQQHDGDDLLLGFDREP